MHPAAKIILRSLSGIWRIWRIPVLSNILLIIVSMHYASSIISKLPRYNSFSSNITIFHQHEQRTQAVHTAAALKLHIIVSMHYASSIISKLPRYNSFSSNITIFHQHEQRTQAVHTAAALKLHKLYVIYLYYLSLID